jgi:hypothetical protein
MLRCSLLAIVLLPILVTTANAQELVTTVELGTWPEALVALESDVAAQGRTISICVQHDGREPCAPCGSYELGLDAAGAAAFRIGECDPASGTTQLTLVDRSALFDHDDVVPRPRSVTIHATLLSSVSATGGSAPLGGASLACTARVDPFLRDLEHGTVVMLRPDRYDVRVLHAGVSVTTVDETWLLSSSEQITSEVEYTVVERATGRVELRGRASLVCAGETDAMTAVAVDGAIALAQSHASALTPQALVAGVPFHADRLDPDTQFFGAFRVQAPTRLRIRVHAPPEAVVDLERFDSASAQAGVGGVVVASLRIESDGTRSFEGELEANEYVFHVEGTDQLVSADVATGKPSDLHVDIVAGTTLDGNLGQVMVGGGGEILLRGWFGDPHLFGWGAGLSVAGTHTECSNYLPGHCTVPFATTTPMRFDADIVSFAVPFAIVIELWHGFRDVIEVGPGLTYASGAIGGHGFGTVFATAQASLGFDFELLDFLLIQIRGGYRFWTQNLGPENPLLDGVYQPSWFGRAGIGVTF